MGSTWQIQEAKNRFSELIEKTLASGPQIITYHGKPVVKVVALTASESRAAMPDDGFLALLLGAPKIGAIESPRRSSRRIT